MEYCIENKHLKVTITDKGAELMSVYGKKTGFEYLWQGNPEFWSGRAYVLFPICGRLTDGKYTFNGKEYQMNLHGFARKTVYEVVKQSKTSIVFGLKSNETTKTMYPFDFDFKIKYLLKGATVRTLLFVNNTGVDELLFSVGGHPGFNLPLDEGAKFSDYYLEFNKAKKVEQLVMSETCYYTGKNIPFELENDKILRLKHSLFDNDAIFLEKMDNTVTLKSNLSDKFVKVKYKDMTHLGFWHAPKTEAPYVCIEPWHGVPAIDKVVDDFSTKRELMKLKSGKTYKSYIDISVNE